MKLFSLTFIAILLTTIMMPAYAVADKTDLESVRRMCTAPDMQDFSVFDQALLPGILIEIIKKDPESALDHERVVLSAIKALGATKVPEAIPVLIEQADKYPATCVYWLANYADSSAVACIIKYLYSKDASVRHEAAEALSRIPAPSKTTTKEYASILDSTLSLVAFMATDEEDKSVVEALWRATTHLLDISLQFSMQ